MRLQRTLLASVVLLSLSFGKTNEAQEPSQRPVRDPLALNVLARSLAAVGDTSLSSVRDYTGSGTVTYRWAGEDVSGSVQVYGKGSTQFRMDSTVATGTQSFVVNGKDALLVPASADRSSASIRAKVTVGTLTLPEVQIARALADSTATVLLVGPVGWNGSQAIQVHVALATDSRLIVASGLRGLGEFDLYFDPNSARLQGLAQKTWWNDDLAQSYLHELIFSNYQTSNGLSVPFTIAERINGQETWIVTLNSLILNSGLPDDIFQVQASEDAARGWS